MTEIEVLKQNLEDSEIIIAGLKAQIEKMKEIHISEIIQNLTMEWHILQPFLKVNYLKIYMIR